jgi:hypothetical protein
MIIILIIEKYHTTSIRLSLMSLLGSMYTKFTILNDWINMQYVYKKCCDIRIQYVKLKIANLHTRERRGVGYSCVGIDVTS